MKRFFWILLIFFVACQQTSPIPNGSGAGVPESTPQIDLSPTLTNFLWSDASTWDSGQIPQKGDNVTIPEGKSILLDVSPPALNELTIEGSLVFDAQDLNLSVAGIVVAGRLELGSPEAPFLNRAVITLTGDKDKKRIVIAPTGIVSMHGQHLPSWTKLAKTALQQDDSISLLDETGWLVNDKLVIASTDYDFEQAESFFITDIRKTELSLDNQIQFMHWGELQNFADKTLDQRAEVGRLSRNITIQGDESSLDEGIGGHIMVTAGGQVYLDSVELYRMGQRGELGRYPLHWHLNGDKSRGQYLKNSSVHDSFNRCVTIHGSHGVLLSHNVAFNTEGHCFFLEDGAELDNIFRHNLVLSTYRATEPLLPTDGSFPGPASFWITNPDNLFEGNVAGGSAGTGFWYALPENPTGMSADQKLWPRFTPLGGFTGNVAHSNYVDGLHVDTGPKANPQDGLEPAFYDPRFNPNAVISDNHGNAKNSSKALSASFDDLLAYKNRRNAVWLRGLNHTVNNAIMADNAVGVTLASKHSNVSNSLFIGESANIGTPELWMISEAAVGEDGRSLPKFWQSDFVIRGFEFYDGDVAVENSHFEAFTPNTQREAAALSYLDFTHFVVSPKNSSSGLTFGSDTKVLHLVSRDLPTNASESEDGYRSALFVDKDGSVTGTANAVVTVTNPILVDSSCSFNADWNAHVCSGDYASLKFTNVDAQAANLGAVPLRRSDGATHTLLGTPSGAVNTRFVSNIRLGQEYHYELASTPLKSRLMLDAIKPAQGVVISLPYPHKDVFIYRDYWIDSRNLAQKAQSLEQLRSSMGNQYYLADGILHIKLMSQKGYDWASLDICALANCR